MKFIRRTIDWLGPARSQAFFILLAFTGLASLILNAVRPQPEWVRLVQSLLVILFLVGATIIILSRLPSQERRQLALTVGPFIVAVALGLLFPQLWMFFIPVGGGWLFLALLLMRGKVSQEYRTAIKLMRNNEYAKAIQVITDVIGKEPQNADHYRFRAELFRLWGKIKRARADYEKVIELTPESGVGYNGLAEVYLQDSEFESALPYAQKALELEPDYWVAPYNLGMIEDRLNMSDKVVEHLSEALHTNIPDSRHRLLTHLWLARSYSRQGKSIEAASELDKMKREKTGLKEWETIFENEAAAVLKDVLEADVNLARQLVNDEVDTNVLTGETAT